MKPHEVAVEFGKFKAQHLLSAEADMEEMMTHVKSVMQAISTGEGLKEALKAGLDLEYDITWNCEFFGAIGEKLGIDPGDTVEVESPEDPPKTCSRCSDWVDNSTRKCAFRSSDGGFNDDNWRCGTMNELRRLASLGDRCDESAGSIGIIKLPDGLSVQGYLVLTWHKDRGRTGGARIVYEYADDVPLTREIAEEILHALGR
jgi:hypothetical protein